MATVREYMDPDPATVTPDTTVEQVAILLGEQITPADVYTEGIRRIQPLDFQYAHRLGHTIRLLCTARQTDEGLLLSVAKQLEQARPWPRLAPLAGVD